MKANGRVGSGARGLRGAPGARAALAALLFLTSVICSSGEDGLPRRTWGFTAGGLFPSGDFNRHGAKAAIGASLFSGWRVGETPFLIGLELAGNFYGVSLFSSRDDTYNTIVQALSFLRLQPRTGSVVTYVEVLAGLTYLSTETYYGGGFWDPEDSVIEIQDLTAAAGAGAGLCIKLRQGKEASDREGNPTFLEFKVRYMAGGYAHYLRELEDGSLVQEHSATSIITAQVGLSWFF